MDNRATSETNGTDMHISQLEPETLTNICIEVDPEPTPDRLMGRIGEAYPALRLRHVLTDSDWYRIGGVVRPDATPVADNLAEWVDRESEGSLETLLSRYGESGLMATAFIGRTHYFVAPTGDGAMDFDQIEVEEVEEVIERPLFSDSMLPDSLEDIIDPILTAHLEPQPLGASRYVFRRAVSMSDRVGELASEYTGDARFRRFLDDWEHASAVQASRFCYQFVVTEFPYLSDSGDHLHEVKLLSPLARLLPGLRAAGDQPSEALARRLREVDQAAGFPMAWYFLMISSRFMPITTVQAIHQDLERARGRFGFLAERDMKILGRWIANPYYL